MDGPILVDRPRHVELHYQILSTIDLGSDAANLYHPDSPSRPWSAALLEAYRKAPGRQILQVLPLLAPDLDAMLELLCSNRLSLLDDAPGRRLKKLFGELLVAEADRSPESTREPLEISWLDDLRCCRHHLWSQVDEDCPPLHISDSPSLACGALTRGRATTTSTGRRVAVALEAGDYAFVQTLHEEIHPVTDPAVRTLFDKKGRSTRRGTPGYELHKKLEQTALDVGAAIVESYAPNFLDPYTCWREQIGL